MPTQTPQQPPSPTLALIILNPAQCAEQSTHNSQSWRGALSLEAYIRREAHLAAQDATKDGGMTTWGLVDTALPEAERVVLCACDTYRKKAFVARGRARVGSGEGLNGHTNGVAANGEGDGGAVVKEVTAYGIGSVFCPKENRGKGYAGMMLRELGKKLRKWQAEDSEEEVGFTALWSDIGKKFYASLGWHPYPSSHISLPASSSIQTTNLPPVKLLYAHDLPALCSIDESILRTRLSKVPSNQTWLALTPNIATIRWHHAREDFVSNEVFKRSPLIKGALVGTEPGKRVWCYFNRFWYNPLTPQNNEENTLHVLRMVHEDEEGWRRGEYVEAVASLLEVAMYQAREWGLETVDCWSPDEVVTEAARRVVGKVDLVDREEESIPSLMWYGDQLESEKEEVVWVASEKYAWC